MYRLSSNLGTSTSWNPQDLSRSVRELLFTYTREQINLKGSVHSVNHGNRCMLLWFYSCQRMKPACRPFSVIFWCLYPIWLQVINAVKKIDPRKILSTTLKWWWSFACYKHKHDSVSLLMWKEFQVAHLPYWESVGSRTGLDVLVKRTNPYGTGNRYSEASLQPDLGSLNCPGSEF
jgi:hypothetical protein